MPKINVIDRAGTPHSVEADNGLTVMEPLRELDEGIEALCGGMCSCATCHVFVDPQWFDKLPKCHSDEMELLEGTENFRAGQSRLSCQIKINDSIDGIQVTIAPEE